MNEAEDDEEADAIRAARHEKWSLTEGEGLGKLGEVRLAVDDVTDSKVTKDLRAGKTTVRI